MSDVVAAAQLKRTPLYRLHRDLGARMVPFAGYEMPVQYPSGILKEHLHVRAAAGLFDVSHMGQFAVRSRANGGGDAARALESIVPMDIVGLAPGRQRYALLTNEEGGVRDDLMIARLGEVFFVVANAACKDADESYLRQTVSPTCTIERLDDRALLALQGPAAEAALARLVPDVRSMRFMDVRAMEVLNVACTVSRSGYTGEDGFEISLPASHAETVARALLANGDVAMIGLGARDSLRLEAGLCLYGSDLDATTTPVEAGLEWSIQKVRRSGGSRAGNFPGAERILHQLANGAPRRRVGLRPEGRAPIRHGAQLFADQGAADAIGVVTSGGFGPTVNAPIAMGYVTPPGVLGGGTIYADLRGTRVPLRLSELPFISTTYKR
ncbi:MAG: aminomethyltransferase [Alphaproteobacteria bacterium]|jgi:aminomethyltransferase|nr:aminomethyltransferase [Alphaproteobacteria bacterium]MEA2966724.1 aminomethyltransferase [Alphaproteobacteria bacterium]MEA2968426.1 aminomethyltransferase [Alphaproteobacteria bacterium]